MYDNNRRVADGLQLFAHVTDFLKKVTYRPELHTIYFKDNAVILSTASQLSQGLILRAAPPYPPGNSHADVKQSF